MAGERYLVPRRITQRWELFPGWGRRELLTVLVGAAVAAALTTPILILGMPLPLAAVTALLPIGGAAGLAMPQPTSDSLLVLILFWRGYLARPRLYVYDHRRDDA